MKLISQHSPLRLLSRLAGFIATGFLLLTLAAPHARAQTPGAGSISGAVSEKGGSYVAGAEVRVKGTQFTAITDRAGQFRIEGVATGPAQVTVDYLGYKTVTQNITVHPGENTTAPFALVGDVVIMDTYRVESVREGQSRAINQQRASNTISNIISSDAIGNLPDRTVGEALGRLPGVNVVDDSFASIRGTAAQYNAVTLDGDRFNSGAVTGLATQVSGDTRATDLSMIPAEIVGGIEVIKVLTADKEADSFGGTINLVTRSAFNLKNRSINGNAAYIFNDYGHNSGYTGSFTYMDVLNKARTVGIAATITYRNEDRNSDKYEITYYQPDQIPVGTAGSGTPGSIAAVGDQGMSEFDMRFHDDGVQKLGATLNLDWKPFTGTELHFRTFYDGSDNSRTRYRLRARSLSRWDASSTAEFESGKQVRLTNTLEDSDTKQYVLRFGVDGESKLSFGELDYGVRYNYTETNADLTRYIFDFPTNTERRKYAWSFDRSDPMLPAMVLTNIANKTNGLFDNLADRKLFSIRFQDAKEDEGDLSANVDYSFDFTPSQRHFKFKFGAKYRDKQRHSRPNIRDYSPRNSTPYTDFTIVAEPTDLLRGKLPSMGPFVSLPEVLNTYYTNPSSYIPTANEDIIMLEARKYDVSEQIIAGYGMVTAEFGKLETILGVRWEQTKTDYTWLADPKGPSSGSNSYGDPYPSLVLNYRFTKNLIARGAITTTLARPNYGDLIPYVSTADTEVDSGGGGFEPDEYAQNKVYLGNSQLKAQQSVNFDLSLEYYVKPSGLLSIAVFEKQLTNIIYRAQWMNPTIPNTVFFQDRNGSSGKVSGIELTAQYAFTFLPGFLSGFGINANATFTKGSSVLQQLNPNTLQYEDVDVDFLPEQPKRVYNVQLWWEKYGFTARVAAAYVGEFVRTTGGLTDMSVNNDSMRWDVSLSYRISKNFTVYVEGRNISNEVTSWYAGTPNRPESYTYPGSSYTGGVKFRF